MRQRRSQAGGMAPAAKGPEALPALRGFRVEIVRRSGARPMRDFGPTHWSWTDPELGLHLFGGALAGALVRVRPPAGASPERVERLRGLLAEGGAAAVKVLPPAAGPAIAPQAAEAPAARGIRETVVACAERSRSKDRGRLDAVLDGALTAEGL